MALRQRISEARGHAVPYEVDSLASGFSIRLARRSFMSGYSPLTTRSCHQVGLRSMLSHRRGDGNAREQGMVLSVSVGVGWRSDHLHWANMSHSRLRSRPSARSVRLVEETVYSARGGEKYDPRIRSGISKTGMAVMLWGRLIALCGNQAPFTATPRSPQHHSDRNGFADARTPQRCCARDPFQSSPGRVHGL